MISHPNATPLTWLETATIAGIVIAIFAAVVVGLTVGGEVIDHNFRLKWSEADTRDKAESERLIDWCLGKGGSAHINAHGRFKGCTIPAK